MEKIEILSVYSKKSKEFWTFSRFNLILGPSASGKSTLFDTLAPIFSGKDSGFLVNGTQTVAKDFNVIAVPSGDTISGHCKLGAKSLLKKAIVEHGLSNDAVASVENAILAIESASKEIEDFVLTLLPDATVGVAGKSNELDFLLSNMSIHVEDLHSSKDRRSLLDFALLLANNAKQRSVLLIDDVDESMSEEDLNDFIARVSETDSYVFLFSRRPVPQSRIDSFSLFSIRDYKLVGLPPLPKLVSTPEAIADSSLRSTFEDYIVNAGYIENSGIVEQRVKEITSDESMALTRLLCSRNPSLPTGLNGYRDESVAWRARVYQTIIEILNLR